MTAKTVEQQNDELIALMLQTAADGRQRFSNAEIRHFLPLAVLQSGVDVRGSPDLQKLMREFMTKLELPSVVDSITLTRAVNSHYRKYPPNPELERQYYAFCRSLADGELDPDIVRVYAKAAGIKVKDQTPMRGMAPPAGGMSLRRR